MSTLIYLTGEPGTGKTTLMHHLTAPYTRHPQTTQPARDILTNPNGTEHGTELGRRREGLHSGTDALPMNIMPKALTWLTTTHTPLIYAEGDRLATQTFLTTARDNNHTVHLIHCHTPQAPQRRHQRGTNQNPTWIAGRATKTRNLTRWANNTPGITLHTLDTTQPPTQLATTLHHLIPHLQSTT